MSQQESVVCEHWNMHVANSLQNRLIYKDECTRCFLTPKDDFGLNVCLTCFQGSCANPAPNGHNHSDQHVKSKEHPIFINIKLTPKAEKDGEIQPEKITKLAIGKPGGIDADTDKYDTCASAYCNLCQKELPMENPTVSSMVNSVLLANSAFNSGVIQEWEVELKSCVHVQSLPTSADKADMVVAKSMAHCEKCDLKSNLWLCMTCGALGCGRKFWDGSGGNNHAVEHFEQTQHAVALKLGTMTPEGGASLYCYACNDDVKDEQLGAHMARFGIDIATQKKTEKSIAEINLQANLDLHLSKILEEGVELTPVFGEHKTGMENLGNSCYVNSVVQCLFSQPEFRKFYEERAQQHLDQCTKFSPDCFLCQISKLSIGLASGEYSQKKVARPIIVDGEEQKQEAKDQFYQDGIRPSIFKQLVGKGHEEFQTGQQQDARQYFSHLLEAMFKGENAAKSGQDPQDAFTIELEQRLQCQTCHCVKYKTIKENCLILTIPVESKVEAGYPVSLDACLEATFQDQLVEAYSCPKCQKQTTIVERKRFMSYPNILAFCLRRLVSPDWVPIKLEVDLQMDKDAPVDLSRFVGNGAVVQPGEEAMPEEQVGGDANEPDMVEPQIDANILNQLIMMGVPELAAKHAIHNTGGSSAEQACEWFYSNIENPACQEPLLVPNPKKGAAGSNSASQGFQPDAEAMMMLTSMGFTDKQAKRALRKCDNSLERAGDWIMCHMDDPDSEDQEQQAMQVDQVSASESSQNQNAESLFRTKTPEKSQYLLQSFITHMGSSVNVGHYVNHVREPTDKTKWIYYNDNKVAHTTQPPIGKGYMYFLRQI